MKWPVTLDLKAILSLLLANALVWSLAISLPATAMKPLQSEWDRYITPLMANGHSSVVGTAQTAVTNRAGETHTDERNAWLFNNGDLIVVQCPLEACFCFTMEDELAVVTMGSGTTCGEMTDSGTPDDGQGVCFRVPAGMRRDIKVNLAAWYGMGAVAASSRPGYRDGYCSQSTGTIGYPCDANDDCVTSGGAAGTCTLGYPDRIKGVFLMHEAASATNCSVEVER